MYETKIWRRNQECLENSGLLFHWAGTGTDPRPSASSAEWLTQTCNKEQQLLWFYLPE